MEDIEKLKKIAKLSQEMRKHGFADYSDEALKVAESVYKENIADAQTPEQRHQALMDKQHMTNQNTQEAESFKKQYSQRIEELEANVATLISKMNEMIKEINELQKGGGASRHSTSESQTQRREEAPAQQQLPKIEPKQGSATGEGHARSGNYTPQDVQIDKIFYFGSGKKPK